ncbi:hypothetical protein JAAARDRAFT_478350 [Jaapia argillacea MUCL 33604]|uniref:Uncharacterized protein n=1 Tax=Jaapia argillacea MUCL 33604 TaxID=933084 RepID=A0A067PC88_9AGAM|nr:hypothetical protein JAAARDRAFT_478350 [Jaapia argillacea MUCL 33604]
MLAAPPQPGSSTYVHPRPILSLHHQSSWPSSHPTVMPAPVQIVSQSPPKTATTEPPSFVPAQLSQVKNPTKIAAPTPTYDGHILPPLLSLM